MLMGINEVLIISTPNDTPHFERLLNDGSSLGMEISYKIQEEPNGIAQAFLIGEDFINNNPVTSIDLDQRIYYLNFFNDFDINNIDIRASNNDIHNKMLENLKNF